MNENYRFHFLKTKSLDFNVNIVIVKTQYEDLFIYHYFIC